MTQTPGASPPIPTARLDVAALCGPGAFRLFLAVVVFVDHATRVALGPAAVKLFFCLSGFWIYRMWSERYVHTAHPLFTYLVSRAWRLIPTFALIALLTLAFQHLVLGWPWSQVKGTAGWPQFIASHLFILGYSALPAQPMMPAWSLDVEMQFYLVAPLLIALTAQVAAPVLLALAAAASLACGLRFGAHASPTYALFFAMGIVAARGGWRPGRKTAAASALVAAGFVVCVIASPWRGLILGGLGRGPLFRYTEVATTLAAILAFPYAIFTARQRGGAHDKAWADLSYIVYLLHWAAINWLNGLASPPLLIRLGDFLAALTATFAVAWAIWRLYDRPLNAARGRWVAGRLTWAAPASRARPRHPAGGARRAPLTPIAMTRGSGWPPEPGKDNGGDPFGSPPRSPRFYCRQAQRCPRVPAIPSRPPAIQVAPTSSVRPHIAILGQSGRLGQDATRPSLQVSVRLWRP